MSLSSLRTGERIAVAAAALLFFDLFLNWYGYNLGEAFGVGDTLGVTTSASGWESFQYTDIVLFLIVSTTLGLLLLGSNRPLPVPRSAIVAGIGALATLLILWRLVNQPGPDGLIDVRFGAYLGLLLAAGIAFGGWRTMQEEGTSLKDVKAQAERAVGGRDPEAP
jgi:hypothetical protein